MTDDVLAPVISFFSPSAAAARIRGDQSPRTRPALPMANLEPPRDSTAVYGIRAVDTNGRVADKSVLGALGWRPGDNLIWRVNGGLIVITRPGRGKRGVTKYGHLWLPAEQRRATRIRLGDRVLLAADPDQGLLVVFPPHVLDEMAARRFADGSGT
ncbi:hypothetical protein OH799_06700 [Nocardia sp. NBC_00881]|uniref:hypothetical protein n=1 Tax=Nocardia sp. NBC_00881 TaxID=2975995 RepID=UPI003866A3E2|nr:hypothetical protein OH799_06700 [Nocardia sp. NBC_00881]